MSTLEAKGFGNAKMMAGIVFAATKECKCTSCIALLDMYESLMAEAAKPKPRKNKK